MNSKRKGNRDSFGRFVGNPNIYHVLGDCVICTDGEKRLFICDFNDLSRVRKIHWWQGNNGYAYGRIKNHVFTQHRYIFGASDGELIDHINQEKTDNRKCNLRVANKSINAFNSKMRSTNKTGVTGVYFRADTGRWSAEIKINYKKVSLGCYSTKEEAAEARKRAEIKYYGAVL